MYLCDRGRGTSACFKEGVMTEKENLFVCSRLTCQLCESPQRCVTRVNGIFKQFWKITMAQLKHNWQVRVVIIVLGKSSLTRHDLDCRSRIVAGSLWGQDLRHQLHV